MASRWNMSYGNILADMILFFGSFILLAILALVLCYCWTYQGRSNAICPILFIVLPAIHYIIFQDRS